MLIEFLLAVLAAALSGWVIEAVSGGAIDRAISGFRELLGGWRPDPWPRGVQEEDRDRPWGSGSYPIAQPLMRRIFEPAAHPVGTAQVRGRTRPR